MALIIILAIGSVFVVAQPAWAYIDPGTGGYVYSMIAPMLAMAGAALAFLFRPVRSFFGRIFGLFKKDKPMSTDREDEI